jgi:hypothetical protein
VGSSFKYKFNKNKIWGNHDCRKIWHKYIVFEKRNRRSNNFFDELCTDQKLTDPENNFKINVFSTNTDITISQLRTRFIGMNNIVNMFKFIFPKNLALYSEELTHFAKIIVE